MEMNIVLSKKAKIHLRHIFGYYKTVAGTTVANGIIEKIIDSMSNLSQHSEMGMREPLLVHYPNNYRYLVDGNYKIIYWMNGQDVIIASVFDCRRNPKDLFSR